MRTTLDIDDDLLAAAKELARHQNLSAGQVVSSMLRLAMTGKAALKSGKVRASGVAGFQPLPKGKNVTTNDLVNRLRDAEGV
jgi:Arc/MetJ family transcription regulator